MFNNKDEQKNNPFEDESFNKEAEDTKAEEQTQPVTEEDSNEADSEAEKTSDNDTAKLQAELDSLNNKYLRLAADFDNFRKRQMSERENLLKYGAEDTLKKIITVLDTFERAKNPLRICRNAIKLKKATMWP